MENKEKKKIITISREFGSGGRIIGKRLAEKLDVPYYDRELLDRIAEESGFSKEMIETAEKKAKNGFLYSLASAMGTGEAGPESLSLNERFFLAQFDTIRKIAEEGSCVIVGRCADYILRGLPYATNVFIYAEEADKIKRAVEEYGVPQARHRYVIVGIRSDVAARNHLTFRPPAPTHGKGREPFVSCAAALAHVPPGPVRAPSERIVWRLRFTAPGDNAWKLDELADPEKCSDDKLDAYLRQLPWYADEIAPLGPLAAIRAKIAEVKLNCKAARMSHIYRRLDPARPAYTLTGSGGGGTHVYHWREHRALTNAERAALQTFPANFIFKGTLEQVRKQIGMAVPTRGAEAIFRAILHTFAHVDYPFVHPDPALVFANGHCRTELPLEG